MMKTRSIFAVLTLLGLLAPNSMAQPNRFVIIGSASQTAGTSQSLTIRADSAGFPATSYNGSKSLTFSGASASLNPVTPPSVTDAGGTQIAFGSPTNITFVDGIATVSGGNNGVMRLYRAETATISVSDGTLNSSGGGDLTGTVAPASASSFNLVIASPQVNDVAFTGSNTLTALDSWGNTATTFNASASNVTLTSTLAVTISGLGSGGNNVLNQAGDFVSGVANLSGKMKVEGTSGSGTFTATSGPVQGESAMVLVNAGAATQVRVETKSDGTGTVVPAQGVVSGNSITVYAISRDKSNNYVNNVAAETWSLQNIVGGVVAGDLVANANKKSAVFTGHLSGSAQIQAFITGLSSVNSGTLTVSAGTATKVQVETKADGSGAVVGAQNVTSGDSITVYSISRDAQNNFLGNIAATWSMVSMTGGVASGDLTPSGDSKSAKFKGRLTGTGQIRASSGILTPGTSGILTVVGGTPVKLVMSGLTSQQAGVGNDLTITAKDAAGNTATGYSGDLSLTFAGADPSPAPVTAPTVTDKSGVARAFGTATTLTFTNGEAKVSGTSNGRMFLYKAQTAAVTATGTLSATGSDGLTVTVSAGTPGKFLFVVASPQKIGDAFTGVNTLTAQDAWGNTVTTFDAGADNVTVTANSPLVGTVSGLGSGGTNVLNQTADFAAGVADLTGKMKFVGSTGTGTFTATSGTGKTGVSGSVTVSSGTATKLVITGSSTQTAGSTQNLTITAKDNSNNTAASYTGSKTLTFSGAGPSPAPVTSPTVENSSGTPVVFGQPTAITFTNGVATVSSGRNGVLALYDAGTDTISATDGTISSAGADRLTVTVSPATLSKFIVAFATPQINGVPFTGTNTITASDAYGNPLTTFDASLLPVTVTSSLAGNITGLGGAGNNVLNRASDFTLGVATVTGKLRFTGTGGTGTFTATASGPVTGTSGSILVNNPVPTISTITPDSADRRESITVQITGTNFFAGTTTVSFGSDIAVSSLTVNSSTQLTAQIVIGATATIGPRDVTVTNAAPGGGTATKTGGFKVTFVPTLTSLSPTSGVRGQTLDVIITGTNFESGISSVGIDPPTILLNSQSVDSPTQITANVTIPHNATSGVRQFTVRNSGAYGGTSNALGFTVGNNPAPTLSSVTPSTGIRLQTQDFVFRGTGFYGGMTTVNMGPGITVNTVVIDSSTGLRVNATITDSAASGVRQVSVINPAPGGGTASSAFNVANPRPTITGITPQTANRLETRTVTVTGSMFIKGVTTLDMGAGIRVDSLTVASSSLITARAHVDSTAASGPRNVYVSNPAPGGGVDTLANAFTVNNPGALIVSLSPSSIPLGTASLQLTVNGASFIPESIVRFDTTSLTTVYVSTSQLRATVPAGLMDTAKVFGVTVLNPGAGISNQVSFTVNNPLPVFLSVVPDTVIRLQSVGLAITGTGFVRGFTTVGFNPAADIRLDSVKVATASQLTAYVTISGSAAVGNRTIAVVNPAPGGGSSATRPFVINGNPAPVLTGILPSVVNRLQKTDLGLTGQNFITGVTTVNLGPGITVDSTRVDSSTHMTVHITIASNAPTGLRSITVTNAPPGGGVSAPKTLQVNNPMPILIGVTPSNGEQLQSYDLVFRGGNFIDTVTTLSMGAGITINAFSVVNDSLLTAKITIGSTAAVGPRDIQVTNAAPGGGVATLTGGFVVGTNPSPKILSVAPDTVRRLETMDVVVRGTNFLGGVTTLDFGAGIALNSVTVDSSTRLTASITVADNAIMGIRNVSLTNRPPGGGTDTLENALTVVNPVPVLTTVLPTTAQLLQTLNVVFTGANFLPGITSVSMGQGITLNSVTYVNHSQIVVNVTVTSGATAGIRDVSVANAAPGGGTSSPKAFTIGLPGTTAPTLLYPTDGANGVIVSPTLRWYVTPGASGYRLEVSLNSEFSAVVLEDTAVVDTLRKIGPLSEKTVYYWRVQSKYSGAYGALSGTRLFTTGSAYPSQLTLSGSVAFPTKNSPSEYATTDYRLIGLPGSSGVAVEDLLGGVNGTDWQAYWDNGDDDISKGIVKYAQGSDFTFSTGRAFWVVRKGALTISRTIPSAPLDDNGAVQIPLHPGWNTITNPFPSTVSWATILYSNSLPTSSTPLYGFEGTFAQQSVMDPYKGFYFFNTFLRTSLAIPYESIRPIGKVQDVSASLLWNVRIALENGGVRDDLASFGVASAALAGVDTFDYRRPRAVGSLPAVYFERPEWDKRYSIFACDVRPPAQGLERWDFSVDATVGKPSVLRFAGVATIPENQAVVLVDKERAKGHDLRIDGQYPFTPAVPQSHFSVVVGSAEEVQEVLNALRPQAYELGDNFPNPFNPTTTIPVAVPVATDVTLKVYSLLGEEVRTLHSGPLQPGRYWFVWDGSNNQGGVVSSGVYLSRMTTSSGVAKTKKMILMK